MEKKRLTAKKASIAEITSGKFIKKPGFESNYVLTKLGRRISRVRVLGLVVNKFETEDGRYATITLDDGSDTIRCKAFINIKIFQDITKGDLADVVGKLRQYDDEIYIVPEIIRKVGPNWETLRLLELKKIWDGQMKKIEIIRKLKNQASDLSELKALAKQYKIDPESVAGILEAEELELIEQEKKIATSSEIKEKIIKLISELDDGIGADYEKIVERSGLPERQVDSALHELLEEGTCFEPKAGKIKLL